MKRGLSRALEAVSKNGQQLLHISFSFALLSSVPR